MPAAYDKYDYPQYWVGREYEHKAEVIALKAFLKKIPKVKTILEIGAGYGRLTPFYFDLAPKIILTDPSTKLLKIARESFQQKKIHFLNLKAENLSKKIKKESVELVIMVRVLHHIKDIHKTFHIIDKITKKGGFLILEFANKCHLKATILEFLRGNFTYLLDIFPKEIKTKKKKSLPFRNYHPDTIFDILKGHGYKILEVRSVSNVRNAFLKRFLPAKTLLFLETLFQKPFAKFYIGPSIFVLAKKKSR